MTPANKKSRHQVSPMTAHLDGYLELAPSLPRLGCEDVGDRGQNAPLLGGGAPLSTDGSNEARKPWIATKPEPLGDLSGGGGADRPSITNPLQCHGVDADTVAEGREATRHDVGP